MKTKLAAAWFLALFTCIQASAQNYAFKVLVNKGKNEVKVGNGWQQLKVGSSLKPNDELKVSENAYVGLVHVSGKPLEVKQAGKYKVEALASQIKGGASVLNKYTDYILSSNEKKANNLQATGSVNRGDEVKLYLPTPAQSPLIYNDEVIISWGTDKIPAPYVVRFRSMFDDELATLETSDNFVKINLADATFANEDNILVTVEAKTDKNKISNQHTLKRLSKADKERINTLLSQIASQTQEATALNKLLLAGFYEENGLLIDAGTAHLEAIRLEPNVATFKDAYNDFLLRHQLKEPREN